MKNLLFIKTKNAVRLSLSVIMTVSLSSPGLGAGPGTSSANFLKTTMGARGAAMGGAFVAVGNDVGGIGWNPASLGPLTRQEAAFMHLEFIEGIQHDWLAYAIPHRRWGVWGVNFQRVSQDSIAGFNATGDPSAGVNVAQSATGISYAKSLGGPAQYWDWPEIHQRNLGGIFCHHCGGGFWRAVQPPLDIKG